MKALLYARDGEEAWDCDTQFEDSLTEIPVDKREGVSFADSAAEEAWEEFDTGVIESIDVVCDSGWDDDEDDDYDDDDDLFEDPDEDDLDDDDDFLDDDDDDDDDEDMDLDEDDD